MNVVFRVVQNDCDSRFPVMPEVSVDGGETWHEIPAVALTVHECVDEITTLDLTVYHHVGQGRAA